MKDEWRIFAERVKKLLDARGISQRELADEVGITEVTMSRYITAERVPSATLIPSFAKGCSWMSNNGEWLSGFCPNCGADMVESEGEHDESV